MLLTALKEGGLQWLVVCTKHNKRHDERPDTPAQERNVLKACTLTQKRGHCRKDIDIL